ncbi:MAG: hypothetical protein KGL18_21590 [Burkholderiales bacterium]|nr:hypothetical protein [Burkholderiales bacterium]MDE2158006.1 hypothetical protein [Burkholderiales bacterium]MDE2505565.1 hypothetical protein [Burkholderiales bacterium]
MRGDTDSRLGLQLNYAPNSAFEFVGQALIANREPSASASDAIEWAFAAYRPNGATTLRLGRLNFDEFLMSDYRNVGFAYLAARPPVEYYGSIPSSLDGVDATRTWDTGSALWRAKVFIGRLKEAGAVLDPGYGFSVTREADGLTLRAGWARARFTNITPQLQAAVAALNEVAALPVPGLAAQANQLTHRLDYEGTRLNYTTLGLAYEAGAWQWSAEATVVSESPLFSARAGYALLGRSFGPVTVYGIVSGIASTPALLAAPPWGPELAPLIGPLQAAAAQALADGATDAANRLLRQHTLAVGLRWNLQPRLALKLQLDDVTIADHGGSLWSAGSAAAAHARVATVLLDFIF